MPSARRYFTNDSDRGMTRDFGVIERYLQGVKEKPISVLRTRTTGARLPMLTLDSSSGMSNAGCETWGAGESSQDTLALHHRDLHIWLPFCVATQIMSVRAERTQGTSELALLILLCISCSYAASH